MGILGKRERIDHNRRSSIFPVFDRLSPFSRFPVKRLTIFLAGLKSYEGVLVSCQFLPPLFPETCPISGARSP